MSDVPDDEQMTAAELRVVIEGLGLHQDALATILGVARRTVARWVDGSSPVPDGVRLEVEGLERHAAECVGELVRVANDEADPVFVTYRRNVDMPRLEGWPDYPASWHRAVVFRAALEVPGVPIIYSDEVS